MNWEAVFKELTSKAHPHSTGYCAKYVANALVAGGFKFTRQATAHTYGPILTALGFKECSPTRFQAGDIVVWQPYPRQPYNAGHIQMFDGLKWLSDFVQKRLVPGASFENATCKIYRHPNASLYNASLQ